jgi:nucleotide-binding universal stress UspA family protein
MKKILVPTDFSATSVTAFKYALELALKKNAEIHVLHVLFPSEGVNNNIYDAYFIEDYVIQRKEALQLWIKRSANLPRFRGLTISSEVKIGYPTVLIRSIADEIYADLIVMGTKGNTGLATIVLGSVAAHVIAHAGRPTLIVPPKTKYMPEGKFAFATDFFLGKAAHQFEVLDAVTDLSNRGILVAHILGADEEQPGTDREIAFNNTLKGCVTDFRYLRDQNVPQAIQNFVESTGSVGLVMVSHARNWLERIFTERTSKKLAGKTSVPLLVLHD